MKLKKYYWMIISFLIIILDQISKILVDKLIPLNSSISVIKNFFSICYVQNKGAAFSILQNARWVFIIFTIIIVAAAIFVLIKGYFKSNFATLSIAFVIGGGIGNLIDRIFLGYVIDFISLKFWSYNFAIFNIADSFVCIGTIMFGVYYISHTGLSPSTA